MELPRRNKTQCQPSNHLSHNPISPVHWPKSLDTGHFLSLAALARLELTLAKRHCIDG